MSNLLALIPSIYMMQVYDRVVPTGGLLTLAMLSLVAIFGLAILSALDWLRSRLLVRAGASLDAELAGPTLHLIMSRPRLDRTARAEAMRDLDALRQGISSPAANAIFDIPWAPIYIIVAFLLHPALGFLALFAALLLLALAWDNERSLRGPLKTANDAATLAYGRQVQIASHASEIRALGMANALTSRQLGERAEVNRLLAATSFAAGNHSGLLKFLRLTLQSSALCLGAVLVVYGKVSAGAVFASSLLLSRALAPIDQVVTAWKSILNTRGAYERLSKLHETELDQEHTFLPAPTGAVIAERLTMLAPQSDRIALAEVSFGVEAGDSVAVIGSSGAGKSTLLRALSGAEVPARGHVRFDGASSVDWDPELLALHIGYLPQSFVLFPGTVKENIIRFRQPDAISQSALDEAAVVAAHSVGAHTMILRLPQGYDTPIGNGGVGLSSGQTQRIAIARALFGQPKLLILDEPTAHLDSDAQRAFGEAISRLRASGATIIFATHSSDALAYADKILVLKDGRVERFGPIGEVVPAFRQATLHAAKRAS